MADNYDVAYINDVHSYDMDNNGTVDELEMEVIKISTGTLNANYPNLVRAKNDEAKEMSLALTDAALCPTKENKVGCSSVFMTFDITGTYSQLGTENLTDEDGNISLVITTDGSWKQLEEGSTLNPFRLNLTMTALDGSPVKVEEQAACAMRISLRGENNATGVIETQGKRQETEIYDLSGRRVTKVTKGLYIVNGKKVMVN